MESRDSKQDVTWMFMYQLCETAFMFSTIDIIFGFVLDSNITSDLLWCLTILKKYELLKYK